jgi:hypothetical protein
VLATGITATQMRALVALVVVAVVGLAVDAQIATAGSSQPKKSNPGLSGSVDLGSASVTADVSTAGAEASADVSTLSASVDTTVDVSPTAAPVSATVDASSPVADASAELAAPTVEPPRVKARASTPLGSASLGDDTAKSLDKPIQATRRVVSGGTRVTTDSGRIRVSPTISTPVRRVQTAVEHASTGESPKPAVARPQAAKKAPQSPLLAPSAASTLSPVVGTLEPTPAANAAPPAAVSESKPVPAPASDGSSGAFGSGISAAGFFAILSALLMLAAPIVGRWLRPSIGMALQPAFASLPERPG